MAAGRWGFSPSTSASTPPTAAAPGGPSCATASTASSTATPKPSTSAGSPCGRPRNGCCERFEDGELRPPPRGEAGFVEVAEKAGVEHWFGDRRPPRPPAAASSSAPSRWWRRCSTSAAAAGRAASRSSPPSGCGCSAAPTATLEELEDWELSVTSLDWRERKAQGSNNPARAHGVSSSGHDQFDERLDHNRQRFLAECGGLAARRLEKDGLEEAGRLRPRERPRGLQVRLRLRRRS